MDYSTSGKWMKWAEVLELCGPPDLYEMGFCERVRHYRAGERESPQAAELREGLEEVHDDDGRLVGLVPKRPTGRPSPQEVMRSVDLMMRMARG
ncbi:hypothetical protein HPA02_27320 [Bisbaumannia pacifica]|uniref:Uncharacterized protein n=1 Tax=Bisbaumannia pacifica TaxID=77098 RepID=A0A510XAJ8_9GAMM|nr:hypothetical protein [Halomonas pacifica]GEK48449.1 hypothetical protein HPA02_27320 [Halomonas pacifica]